MTEPTISLTGRLRSLRCALRGVGIVLTTQHNAWLHLAATAASVAAGIALKVSISEWCWIVLAITSVWTTEALNTALELLTDIASPTFDPIAGKAKDVAAGAVLFAACGAGVIGLLVFGPHIVILFI